MRATTAAVLSVLLICARLSPAAPPKFLDFIVVDAKTNRPLPDVKVDANFFGSNFNGQTSADGHALIKLPDTPSRGVYVHVTKKNYVREYVQWDPQANGQSEPLPANFVVHLEPGSAITGRVVDDSGKPVGGAHVALIGRKNFPDPHEHLDSWRDDIIAKADGTWSFNEAPAQLDELSAGVWHQHYANGDYYALKPITPITLVKQPLTLVLKKGVPVEGTVLGTDGKPLAGAEVHFGAVLASNTIPAETTAADGRFAYAALPGDRVTITVKAKSFAPELKQFTMSEQKQDLSIQLIPAKHLVGRVVDPEGKPVANAYIFPDTWRGSRSLQTRLSADKDGRFVWNEAPADTVYCDIGGEGFLRQNGVPLTASDTELTITLRRALHVRGTVVDAQTSKPIDVFTVVPGIIFSEQQPIFWDRSRAKSAPRGGTIDYVENNSRPAFAVRIEAPGYLPAESRTFKESDGEVNLEFKLKPGKDLAATVVQADGKPAAGATVYLILPGQTLQIHDGKSVGGVRSPESKTDANGEFSLPPQSGNYLLVILNDYGYSQFTSVPDAAKLQLQPWAHVEGVVTMDGKPAPSQYINVRPTEDGRFDRNAPRLIHLLSTQSDAQGKFKFDRVPAGAVTVAREVRQATGGGGMMISYADPEKITAAPGQTIHVAVGGSGRTVTGHVVIPSELAADRNWNWGTSTRASLKIDRPKMPLPDDMKDAPVEARRKWMTDFMKTEAGQKYQTDMRKSQEQFRSYPLELKQDGSFTIHNVSPGEYTYAISMARANGPSTCGPGDNIASGSGEFTIAAPDPGSKALSPVELPPVAMQMIKTLTIGQTAPDFTVKTLEGKTLHLADFHGKYLVLDFWASWCAPCVAETPYLRAAAAAFSKDDRFAMLAISLDRASTDAATYIKQNSMTWPQVYLSAGFEDPVVQAYAVHAIPSIWLISPEGKVLAKDLRGDAIQSAIRAAMGSQK